MSGPRTDALGHQDFKGLTRHAGAKGPGGSFPWQRGRRALHRVCKENIYGKQ
jgi:hypothetical protein